MLLARRLHALHKSHPTPPSHHIWPLQLNPDQRCRPRAAPHMPRAPRSTAAAADGTYVREESDDEDGDQVAADRGTEGIAGDEPSAEGGDGGGASVGGGSGGGGEGPTSEQPPAGGKSSSATVVSSEASGVDYGQNYDGPSTSVVGEGLPADLEGVDESLFLDEDLPDDVELE